VKGIEWLHESFCSLMMVYAYHTVIVVTVMPVDWSLHIYSFAANFHVALVGHLLKGFRHPTPTTVSRTTRILTMLLGIVAKPHKRDKFEVTPESVAYLAGIYT